MYNNIIYRNACNMDPNDVDIQPYFPCPDIPTLLDFMSNEDEDYPQKRKAFHTMLYSAITTDANKSNKRMFSDALLNCLFTRQFVLHHSFPCAR